ncbi:MAG TPA: response regulator [Myxococcota bacterium]|nr:response regulator [Myxococcota bacterium]
MDSIRVLIVDDDPDIIFYVRELLTPPGFDVVAETTSDGGLLRMLGEPWTSSWWTTASTAGMAWSS